mmetsp:Transcript_610/g.732  ORF Transcript_610/g.732 Transcript_610/m.732 type:complete len:193 (+) Transcript_610:181-759(+)
MRVLSSSLSILFLLGSTNALAPQQQQQTGRRNFLGSIVGTTAATAATAFIGIQSANAAAIKTGAANFFTGDYDDPQHPGCLRQVKVVGAPLKGDGTRSGYPIMEIVGYDGAGGKTCTDRPTREQLWKIQGKLKSNNEAVIDFSPKGGPANLAASFSDNGITFPDGNKWTKVMVGTRDRRPKDMRTLKSDAEE